MRYAREWLEQQAVAGFLDVCGLGGPAEKRTYALPADHVAALVDPVDPSHVAPFATMVVGISQAIDQVVDGYRTGAGVPYSEYGSAFRCGQGGINRPAFTSDLVTAWLPAAGLEEELASGVSVLDVGMGHGWSSIAIKRMWPNSTVLGVDSDEASVRKAMQRDGHAGVDVDFVAANAASPLPAKDVDVALVLEALHDMAQPASALRSIRDVLTPDGVCIVADEAVAESFVAPRDELERMMYGWSVSHCLPVAMADQPSSAIGTAIRPSTVERLAHEAGYSTCDIVDVDGGFFRIYALRP